MKVLENLLLILGLITLFSHTRAQGLKLGSCIDKQGIDYMDEDKFMGDWYEFARTSHLSEAFQRCTAYRFHQPVKGEWPFSRLSLSPILGWKSNYTQNLKIEGAGKGEQMEGYQITFVDIDYDDYAVVYGCRKLQFLLPKQEIIWILTRDQFPEASTVLKAYDAIKNFGLSLDDLKAINQDDCPDINEFH